jgi:pseudo-rSAM protein
MEMEKSFNYWLIIETYVHIRLSPRGVLFYNTLDSKVIESDNSRVLLIADRLLINKNGYCALIKEEDLKNKDISDFINDLKINFMGDLIPITNSKSAPIQLFPLLDIQNEISSTSLLSNPAIGKNVLNYLYELNIYLNGTCQNNCEACLDTYKQVTCCRKTSVKKEFELDDIKRIINETKNSNLGKINILGGNILNYSQFDELIEIIAKTRLSIVLNLHICNFEKKITTLQQSNITLNLIIDFNSKRDVLKSRISKSIDLKLKTTYIFILSSIKEVEIAESIIKEYKIKKFEFKPFYNGQNIEFFKDEVFLSKDDILVKPISMKTIFRNSILNTNYFGVLSIANDGKVYADLNKGVIGNIYKDSIKDCIFREITEGKSWFQIRNNGKCKECLYRELCPPISNYETVMDKENLCHIIL